MTNLNSCTAREWGKQAVSQLMTPAGFQGNGKTQVSNLMISKGVHVSLRQTWRGGEGNVRKATVQLLAIAMCKVIYVIFQANELKLNY